MRVLAISEVVARLMAYEAQRLGNPHDLLVDFSNAIDERLYQKSVEHQQTDGSIALHEAMRDEVDRIVGKARVIIEASKEGKDR